MKVKAKIHSKYYSVERRKTEGRKEKTKTKKQTRYKGAIKKKKKEETKTGHDVATRTSFCKRGNNTTAPAPQA